jgi:predicted RNase H-like HicB family nuclease
MLRGNHRSSFRAPNAHSVVSRANFDGRIESSDCRPSFGQMENGPGNFIEELRIDMEIKLTAVFRKFPEGYAAFVQELPGANTQGATLEEARENLKEAVAMVLQANRNLAEES